ncbi:helix-turn-helix domain-containing protein [Bacillus mycoides]|uniref:helix-turn-helix domain-containing protein n=1 Tax=Bacillus mycoides TaxID=1405 RepID=UPI003F751641
MFNHERLKELINSRGITQQQLADAIELSHVSVYYYVEGKKSPGTKTLQKIANHFNVTTDYLLNRSDEPVLDEMLDKKFKQMKERMDSLSEDQQAIVLKQMESMMESFEQLNNNSTK